MTIEKYKKFAKDAHPVCWHQIAGLLHDNASTLYEAQGTIVTHWTSDGTETSHFVVNRSVFLLCGFAMENLLKALLIYEHPEYIADGKLSNKITTHKLSKLLEQSNLATYKARYRNLFVTLESGLTSWARYPCGLNFNSELFERKVTPRFWRYYQNGYTTYRLRLEKLLTKTWVDPYGEEGRCEFWSST